MSHHASSKRQIGVRTCRGGGHPEISASGSSWAFGFHFPPAEIPELLTLRRQTALRAAPWNKAAARGPEPIQATAHRSPKEHYHQRDAEGFRLLPVHQSGAGPVSSMPSMNCIPLLSGLDSIERPISLQSQAQSARACVGMCTSRFKLINA